MKLSCCPLLVSCALAPLACEATDWRAAAAGDADADAEADGDAEAYEWHAFYGAATFDEGRSVAVDASGNIYLAGTSSITWSGPDGEPPLRPHTGTEDLCVLKLSPDGEYLWHTFHGSDVFEERVGGLAVGADGSVYVAGDGFGSWDGPGGEEPLHARAGNSDVFVLELSPDGAYAWHAFYGSPYFDWGASIAVDAGGNAYVTGHSDGAMGGGVDPFDPDPDPGDGWGGGTPSGAYDLFVLKLAADGNYLGEAYWGGAGQEGGSDIAVDGDGCAYVTGFAPNQEGYDIFVLKLGPEGAYEWHSRLGSADGYDKGTSIAVDGSGNVYVAGFSTGPWTGPDGQPPLHNRAADGGDKDLVVTKIDPLGAYAWHTFFGSDDDENGGFLAAGANGGVYVTGAAPDTWTGPDGEPPLRAHAGYVDLYLLGLDADGAYAFHTFYGAAGEDGGSALALDGDDGLVVTGRSDATWLGPGGAEPLHAHAGGGDLLVLKRAL